MTANISTVVARALSLIGLGLALTAPAHAQNTAVEALQKARVNERLAEGMAVEKKGESPGFVLDPAWPQPLPNNWVIGDVGGIAVDKHDQIWVYHRPRSVGSQDSGMQGAAAKDAKGNAISVLGHPRPNGQINGCCDSAPSILVFNTAGKLLKAWGGPAGARARHLCRSQRFRLHRRQRPGARLLRPVSVGAEIRRRFAHPQVQGRRHLRLSDRLRRRQRPQQQ
jgi:hypothetical protein